MQYGTSHPIRRPTLVGLKDLAQNSASVGKVYRTSAHCYHLSPFSLSSPLLSSLNHPNCLKKGPKEIPKKKQ